MMKHRLGDFRCLWRKDLLCVGCAFPPAAALPSTAAAACPTAPAVDAAICAAHHSFAAAAAALPWNATPTFARVRRSDAAVDSPSAAAAVSSCGVGCCSLPFIFASPLRRSSHRSCCRMPLRSPKLLQQHRWPRHQQQQQRQQHQQLQQMGRQQLAQQPQRQQQQREQGAQSWRRQQRQRQPQLQQYRFFTAAAMTREAVHMMPAMDRLEGLLLSGLPEDLTADTARLCALLLQAGIPLKEEISESAAAAASSAFPATSAAAAVPTAALLVQRSRLGRAQQRCLVLLPAALMAGCTDAAAAAQQLQQQLLKVLPAGTAVTLCDGYDVAAYLEEFERFYYLTEDLQRLATPQHLRRVITLQPVPPTYGRLEVRDTLLQHAGIVVIFTTGWEDEVSEEEFENLAYQLRLFPKAVRKFHDEAADCSSFFLQFHRMRDVKLTLADLRFEDDEVFADEDPAADSDLDEPIDY